MTTKTKGRDRLHGGATPKTFDSRNHTGQDALQDWFIPAESINRQPKRGGQRGRK